MATERTIHIEDGGNAVAVRMEDGKVTAVIVSPLNSGGVETVSYMDLAALANVFGENGGAKPAPAKRATTAPSKAPRAAAPKATTTMDPEEEKPTRERRYSPPDLADVIQQVGESPKILADHYRVPEYTAQGWLTRYRRRQQTTEVAL